MKKCAIYCRVSSAGQDVSSQVESLTRYAEQNEIEIYKTYIDEALSGALSIDERPDFKRLFDDITSYNQKLCLMN